MNFHDDKDGEGRRKGDKLAEEGAGAKAQPGKKPPTPELGNALRSVYQQTVNEDIPPEMLDLLGKLG